MIVIRLGRSMVRVRWPRMRTVLFLFLLLLLVLWHVLGQRGVQRGLLSCRQRKEKTTQTQEKKKKKIQFFSAQIFFNVWQAKFPTGFYTVLASLVRESISTKYMY